MISRKSTIQRLSYWSSPCWPSWPCLYCGVSCWAAHIGILWCCNQPSTIKISTFNKLRIFFSFYKIETFLNEDCVKTSACNRPGLFWLKWQKRIRCFCQGIVFTFSQTPFSFLVSWDSFYPCWEVFYLCCEEEQPLQWGWFSPLLRGLATPGLPSYLPSSSSSPPSSSPSPPCPGEPGDTMTGVLEMTVFRWCKNGGR